MQYRITFKDLAIRDAGEIYDWYSTRGENISERFLQELEWCLNKIVIHPLAYQRRTGNYRSAFLRKFPYEVCYRIKGNEIFILAIYHTSRNPERKFRRK